MLILNYQHAAARTEAAARSEQEQRAGIAEMQNRKRRHINRPHQHGPPLGLSVCVWACMWGASFPETLKEKESRANGERHNGQKDRKDKNKKNEKQLRKTRFGLSRSID